MSDAYEELGYSKKTPKSEKLFILPPPPKKYDRESDEETAKRKARALEAIFRINPNVVLEDSGLVLLEVENKRFDCYPSSNTWYSHSKQVYGVDIPKLCEQIKKHLLPSC